MRRTLWIFLSFFVYSANSFAGILVEPYLGYFTGKATGTVTLTGFPAADIDDTAKGTLYGARLGYTLPLLVGFGLEAAGGTTKVDDDSLKLTNVGAFVSVDLPILLRAYATYFFSSKISGDVTGIGDVEYKGSAMKLGVGLTMLPLVSLNLEYVAIKYDKENSSTITSLDEKVNGIMVGVSLPLNL